MESTKPTSNEAENGNKSKPLLQAVFLAPYLPYALKIKVENDTSVIFTMSGIDCLLNAVNYAKGAWYESSSRIEHIKPILRPLSDLGKDVNFSKLYFTSLDKREGFMVKRINETYTRVNELDFLFRNHYDIYSLIEKGIAISVYDVV